jgi:formylglycine-generating enzyme required for sulfatase activity
VLRGGSWSSFAGDCRSDLLYYPPSDDLRRYVGFRLVFVP